MEARIIDHDDEIVELPWKGDEYSGSYVVQPIDTQIYKIIQEELTDDSVDSDVKILTGDDFLELEQLVNHVHVTLGEFRRSVSLMAV
jgi:hypothetical protein